MRVLFIGGTQFIGPPTVKRALDRGHKVTVLHRTASHDLGPEVENIRADRSDMGAMDRILAEGGWEVVFDFAYDWANGTPPEHVEVAARAAARGGALERYVFMSSIGAYAPGTDLTESAPLVPEDFPQPYAAHKANSERALFRMAREDGLPVSTLRPPFVHGPGQPFYREPFFWDRLRDGRPIILPDEGDALMHLVYVEDLAEAAMRTVEVPGAAGEAFNVGHREPVTHREYVEALAKVAGVEPRLVPVPRETIHAAGGEIMGEKLYFGEVLDLPPLTAVVEKARDVLDLQPTPLERALARGYAWYLEQPRREVDYTFENRLLSEVSGD